MDPQAPIAPHPKSAPLQEVSSSQSVFEAAPSPQTVPTRFRTSPHTQSKGHIPNGTCPSFYQRTGEPTVKSKNKIVTQRSGYDFERRKTFAAGMHAPARASDIQRSFLSGAEGEIRTLARFLDDYSLSRGAPSASWVLPQVELDSNIGKSGGESGIRTHGTLLCHWFSRPAP